MTNSATMASLQRLRKAATLAAKHARLARAGAARDGSFGDLGSRAGGQMQLELDARDLVAPPEVADVTRHPALRALLVAGPDRVQPPAASRADARTGLRPLVDHDAARRLARPQRRLSSSRSASRTVERLTPNCRASSVSEGSRSPSRSARDRIRSPIAAATLR